MTATRSGPMTSSSTAPPMVSVLMLTYNHERFVRQAVASVLSQRTAFTVQLVIGEDCSRDNTRAVVQELARQHPDRISLFLPPRNVGPLANWWECYQLCRGAYVAHLEGDDYWTDPEKLQLQVDHLEAHSDRVACFHDVMNVDEHDVPLGGIFPRPLPSSCIGFDDLIAANIPPSASMIARRLPLAAVPPLMQGAPIGDWPFNLLLSRVGTFGYLPRLMAAYRVHCGGLWSGKSDLQRLLAVDRFYASALDYFDSAAVAIRRHRKRNLAATISSALLENDLPLARRLVWQYVFSRPQPFRVPPQCKSYLLLALSPRLWRGFATAVYRPIT